MTIDENKIMFWGMVIAGVFTLVLMFLGCAGEESVTGGPRLDLSGGSSHGFGLSGPGGLDLTGGSGQGGLGGHGGEAGMSGSGGTGGEGGEDVCPEGKQQCWTDCWNEWDNCKQNCSHCDDDCRTQCWHDKCECTQWCQDNCEDSCEDE